MIPRRIHFIWLSRDGARPAVPEPYATFIGGWRRAHPDWEVMLHQNGDLEERCPLLGPAILQKLQQGLHPALASDLMRVELVYRQGGFYLDADIECVRSLEPLRGCDTLLAREPVRGGAIASGVFAELERGPFTSLLLEDIAAHGNTLQGGSIAAWNRAKERLLREQPGHATTLLAPEAFFPFYSVYVPKELKLSSGCHGIHWYAASWMGEQSKHHQSFLRALRRLRGFEL